MAKHQIMDYSGHSTVEFDKMNPAELEAANARFMELVGGRKHIAATRKAGEQDYTLIKTPDQQQDETLFRPQIRGG